MIKISLVLLLISLTGCVAYTDNYSPAYNGYGQVTRENIIVAPSYIKNPDGSIESAPNGTIYFGRTAPEPVYVTPYNRSYIQPQYKIPSPVRK